MSYKHVKCAINKNGPCTCGYEEWVDELRADENVEIQEKIHYEEEFE